MQAGRSGKRSMAPGIILAIFMAVLYVISSRSAPALENWHHDYPEALAEAVRTDKPLLVAFTMKQCPPCVEMKRFVLNEKEIVGALEAYVPVELDVFANEELAMQWNVQAAPTFLVVGGDGRVVRTSMGSSSVEEFAAFLNKPVPK